MGTWPHYNQHYFKRVNNYCFKAHCLKDVKQLNIQNVKSSLPSLLPRQDPGSSYCGSSSQRWKASSASWHPRLQRQLRRPPTVGGRVACTPYTHTHTTVPSQKLFIAVYYNTSMPHVMEPAHVLYMLAKEVLENYYKLLDFLQDFPPLNQDFTFSSASTTLKCCADIDLAMQDRTCTVIRDVHPPFHW